MLNPKTKPSNSRWRYIAVPAFLGLAFSSADKSPLSRAGAKPSTAPSGRVAPDNDEQVAQRSLVQRRFEQALNAQSRPTLRAALQAIHSCTQDPSAGLSSAQADALVRTWAENNGQWPGNLTFYREVMNEWAGLTGDKAKSSIAGSLRFKPNAQGTTTTFTIRLTAAEQERYGINRIDVDCSIVALDVTGRKLPALPASGVQIHASDKYTILTLPTAPSSTEAVDLQYVLTIAGYTPGRVGPARREQLSFRMQRTDGEWNRVRHDGSVSALAFSIDELYRKKVEAAEELDSTRAEHAHAASLIGSHAPRFTFSEGGKFPKGPHVLKDRLPQKPDFVVLDLAATWCAPCIAALETLSKLQVQFRDRALVVTLFNANDDRNNWEGVQLLAEGKGYHHSFGATPQWSELGFESIPAVIILDKDRKIIWAGDNFGELESQLKKLAGGAAQR